MNTQISAVENVSDSSKLLNVTLWAVQIMVAALFVKASYAKLSGNPQMIGLFQGIGFGQWFRYLTGSFELTGAILLLTPKLSGFGGMLLIGVMLGALATHLFIIGGNPTMAILMLIASLFVAWGRRGQIQKTLSR